MNYVGYSLPTFWLGIMLISIFAAPPLKWFPVGGMWTTRTVPDVRHRRVLGILRGAAARRRSTTWRIHLVLPVFTLVLVNIAFDSRFIRASMLDSLNQDFVKTARAKGVPERTVVFKHALRNALLPVVTNIGLEIPFLFTGRDRDRDDLLAGPAWAASSSRPSTRSTTRC